jgi:hypothetical protein
MNNVFGNNSYCNTEITKFYLTLWSSSVIPYFATDGSKISSYTGLTEAWQQVEIVTATITYSQSLNSPGPNGITFTENITITIPNAQADKWAQLVSVLKDRYVIIFKDANDNYYTMGWKFGTKVLSYTLDTNQYGISFINSSSISLLTSIDASYVTQYVK